LVDEVDNIQQNRKVSPGYVKETDGGKPLESQDLIRVVWQRLRDDLHAMTLEYGSTWLELARRPDVCPAMSGRDFELWQPLLALASWLESQGVQGLLKLMQDHALAVIDHGHDESIPEADDTLLRLLANAVKLGEYPTPHGILERAKQMEPEVFKGWHPRAVTGKLKSYGIPTPRKSGSRREYRNVTLDMLRRIQKSYAIDLCIP
jgi:hypothetical protein